MNYITLSKLEEQIQSYQDQQKMAIDMRLKEKEKRRNRLEQEKLKLTQKKKPFGKEELEELQKFQSDTQRSLRQFK